MHPSISLSILSALAAGLGASRTNTGHEAQAAGTPASLSFGDYDGDGLLDALAIEAEGNLRLLRNLGDGTFDDVSVATGLSAVRDASLVLWEDYDRDGRADLLVTTACGPRYLLRSQEGGLFEDVTASSGLGGEACDERFAQWMDYDKDGRLDLHLEGAAGGRLYHALPDGRFEPLTLGAEHGIVAPRPVVFVTETRDADAESRDRSGDTGTRPGSEAGGTKRVVIPTTDVASLTSSRAGPSPAGGAQPLVVASACAPSIRDQANPSTCVRASTTPALGELYPLSTNLNVSGAGNVGIGTTTPAAKLEVAGTARMTDTLTLAPSGDQALDVSSGSIYKGGTLFIHTKGSIENTALGLSTLTSSTFGFRNTAIGFSALGPNNGVDNTACGARALQSNTTGDFNTACGARALQSNTTGDHNTSNGYAALKLNTTGGDNTASGFKALAVNTIGNYNTAEGNQALYSNTIGNYNTAEGNQALYSNTTGVNNTASGHRALFSNNGNDNTAFGHRALSGNSIGFRNTAIGYEALDANTTGSKNTASGDRVLLANTTGSKNTASGQQALTSNTTGVGNTASGYQTLFNNTTGGSNIALGAFAGSSLTTGDNNIDIGNTGAPAEGATIRIGAAGTHTRAFVAGIRGVTAGGDAIPVQIDSAGQLGTVVSSRRFKEDIRDMGDATEKLLSLRPVTFRYKPEVQAGERPLEYGLIAEEVAEVFPDLVVYDDEGKPFTVKYHLLSAMLLNELEKLHARHEALETLEAGHALEVLELRARVAALEQRAGPAPTSAPEEQR